MSKKKRFVKGGGARALPPKVLEQIDSADDLINRGRYSEALAILGPLSQKHPNRVEILSSQAVCCFRLGMHERYLDVMEPLHRLLPGNPEAVLSLAQAYMLNGRPALALREYRRYLKRWPEGEHSAFVRGVLATVEPDFSNTLAGIGLTQDDRFEIAELHEQSQVYLSRGQTAEARECIHKIFQRAPNFVPGLNNLSQTYMQDGLAAEAAETAERVLAVDPENIHGLGNLSRALWMQARVDEARAVADRLRSIGASTPVGCLKIVETLSYLGDDQGVLDALDAAVRSGVVGGGDHIGDDREPDSAFLYHLVAAAALRLGQEKRAREWWKKCLKIAPGFDLAKENLADLRRPEGERNGPWAFSAGYLIPNIVLDRVVEEVKTLGDGPDFPPEALQSFVERNREFLHTIPYLLEHGDPIGREFAVWFASHIRTPELLAALRDFSLGRLGTDHVRMKAASAAVQAELLPRGHVKMWVAGRQQDVLLLGFEIHSEPLQRVSRNLERLITTALDAMNEGNAVEGERIMRQALELAPDDPIILNNLASALGAQGRRDEGEALLEDIHRRFPDYVFARTNLANSYARRGRIAEAEALIEPLLDRRRLHVSELGSLCGAQIELALARKNRRAARDWFQMWEQADPDNPQLERFRPRVQSIDLRKLWSSLR
ncbi:MAG: tetratricopeptide repeat protein [Acidobacteria bacterium]|nr:tetratricopeptide repeat protein [Acidobacteriota bacterium]